AWRSCAVNRQSETPCQADPHGPQAQDAIVSFECHHGASITEDAEAALERDSQAAAEIHHEQPVLDRVRKLLVHGRPRLSAAHARQGVRRNAMRWEERRAQFAADPVQSTSARDAVAVSEGVALK